MTLTHEHPVGAQTHAVGVSRDDRQRSLDAMHLLESVAAAASPGREQAWRRDVLEALRGLAAAIAEQEASYEDPASLLNEIALEQPRLRTWIRQLRRRWQELADSADGLTARLAEADDVAWNPSEIREQLRWLMSALHHHLAREADLVFEALSVDLGGGD